MTSRKTMKAPSLRSYSMGMLASIVFASGVVQSACESTQSCRGKGAGCHCQREDVCTADVDPRERVGALGLALPARAVGSLGGCTGTLVSPRHVLTAAHCVASGFDGDTFTWTPQFSAGLDGTHVPVAPIAARRVFAPEGYLQDECGWSDKARPAEWDFALIELEQPLAVEPIPYRYLEHEAMVGVEVINIGYPQKGACAPSNWEKDSMWASRAEFPTDSTYWREGLLYTPNHGSPGHSGSSLVTTDTRSGEQVVIGVYIGPFCHEECRGMSATAVRLGPTPIAFLDAWRNDTADKPCCEAWVGGPPDQP